MKIQKNNIKYKRFIIPCRIYGEGDTCLLCVNGAQQSMGVWRQFISVFSKKYRVILFDFPGQGYGKILSEPKSISFTEQLECIEQVLSEAEPYKKLYIFGASWGAIMASAYASKYSAKVDKLILGSFATKGNDKLNDLITEGLRLYEAGEGHKGGDLLISGFGNNITNSLKKKIKHQFASMSEDHFRAFCAHSKFVRDTKDIAGIINFSAISAKTLLVYGKNDTICDYNDVKMLTSTMTNATMKTLDNVGHFLHFEDQSIMNIYYKFYL